MDTAVAENDLKIDVLPPELPEQAWTVNLQGAFILKNGARLAEQLRKTFSELSEHRPQGPITVQASALERFDGAGVVLLRGFIDDCQKDYAGVQLEGASASLTRLLDLYQGETSSTAESQGAPQRPTNWLERCFDQIGTEAVTLFQQCAQAFDFIGATVAACLRAIRQPKIINWREIPALVQRAGADGLIIVALTNILIGGIMAFQGVVQLEQFGAGSMTPVMVTIAHLRELGPIMTAFIVAGRSGAGFAAELGTMRVNEEIDALKTMGLDPMPWLVLPRMLALVCILPLLVIVGNICGLAGGYIAMAAMEGGMTWSGYWTTVSDALLFHHFATGVGKSYIFALAIAALACAQGLAARGGAAAVGVRTTAAVVYSLFAVVILDCVFALLFTWLGV